MPVLSPPDWGGWPPPCGNTRVSVVVDFGASGKFTLPWEREATGPLLRAAGRIHARNADHADGIDPIPGGVYKLRLAGTYNCRQITGGGARSNHSWPLAIDLNWDTNPYHGSGPGGRSDMPSYFVGAFEAEGFHWLGAFDPMHFEHLSHAGCAPIGSTGPLVIDWTVYRKPVPPAPPEEDDMGTANDYFDKAAEVGVAAGDFAGDLAYLTGFRLARRGVALPDRLATNADAKLGFAEGKASAPPPAKAAPASAPAGDPDAGTRAD